MRKRSTWTPVWLARVVVTMAVAIMMPRVAVAQTDAVGDLVTDRPDFTESSRVVGRGIVQVESGTLLELDGAGDERSRTFTAPLVLMRLGVSRRLELRLSGDGDIVTASGRGPGRVTSRGGSDMEVGAKWVLLEREDSGFAMGIIPMLSLPIGSTLQSSGTYDPAVKLTWAKSLRRGFELSGNVNLSRLSDTFGRYSEQAYSVSIGHDLVGDWGMYAEGFGFVTPSRDAGQAWTANAGVTHPIGSNAQFDVEAGRGLTAAAPDWFIGMGMAIRTSALRRLR